MEDARGLGAFTGSTGVRPTGGATGSDVRQDGIERAGHPGQVERAGEHLAIVDLAARAGAQEAPDLLLAGPSPLGGLLDEGAERPELALTLGQLLVTATPSARISSSSRSA